MGTEPPAAPELTPHRTDAVQQDATAPTQDDTEVDAVTETPRSDSPISYPELTRLLGVIREHRAGAPTRAPLITRAAHPGLRREVPDVVLRAVERARTSPRPPVTPVRPLVVPQNLSAVLGLARPTH